MTNRLTTEAGRMRAQAVHFTLPFTLLTTVLLCATAGFAFLAAPAEVEAAEATETAGTVDARQNVGRNRNPEGRHRAACP